MSSPAVQPAFVITNSAQYILRKATTVLGQVQKISLKNTSPTKKLSRIGNTEKSTSYQPIESSGEISIYSELTPTELAALMGATATSGSVIQLDSTMVAFDMFIDVYDGATGSGDTLMGTWTIHNYKPTSNNIDITGDSEPIIQLPFQCDSYFYTVT